VITLSFKWLCGLAALFAFMELAKDYLKNVSEADLAIRAEQASPQRTIIYKILLRLLVFWDFPWGERAYH